MHGRPMLLVLSFMVNNQKAESNFARNWPPISVTSRHDKSVISLFTQNYTVRLFSVSENNNDDGREIFPESLL